jgi:hypothetical protein
MTPGYGVVVVVNYGGGQYYYDYQYSANVINPHYVPPKPINPIVGALICLCFCAVFLMVFCGQCKSAGGDDFSHHSETVVETTTVYHDNGGQEGYPPPPQPYGANGVAYPPNMAPMQPGQFAPQAGYPPPPG